MIHFSKAKLTICSKNVNQCELGIQKYNLKNWLWNSNLGYFKQLIRKLWGHANLALPINPTTSPESGQKYFEPFVHE